MGACKFTKKKPTEEENLRVSENLAAFKEMINSDTTEAKLIRLHLGLYDMAKDGAAEDRDANLRDFIQNVTSIDIMDTGPGARTMTMADIATLNGYVREAQKAIAKMGAYSAKGQFAHAKAIWRKMWYMPKENWNKVVGGRDVFLNTSVHEQQRNVDIEAYANRVDNILSGIAQIAGDAGSAVERERNSLTTELNKQNELQLNAQRRLGEGDLTASADIKQSSEKMQSIQSRLNELGKSGNASTYSDMQSDIIDIITGKAGNVNDARAYLSKKWGKYGKAQAIQTAINDVGGVLNDLGVKLAHASEAGRQVLKQELIRTGLSEAEADDEASRAFHLKMEDNYFPRMSLLSIRQTDALMARLREVPGNSPSTARDMLDAFKAHVAKTRKLGPEVGELERRDMGGVLKDYAAQVVDMEFANNVALTLGNHLRDIESIAFQAISSGDRTMEGYIEGVRKMSMELGDKLTGTRKQGVTDNLVRTAMTWKAVLTMGVPNLATPLVNYIDGHLMPLMSSGIARMETHQGTYRKKWRLDLETLLADAHTKLSSAELIGTGSDNTFKALFSDSYIAAVKAVQKTHGTLGAAGAVAESATGKVASGTSFVADKLFLWGQKAVEQKNRRWAFEIGASEELEFLDRAWKHRFLGENPSIPQWLIKKYSLDPTRLSKEGFDRNEARKAWDMFRMERAKRAGYEMIFNTQFQYTMAAKHWLEGTSPGRMAMMYQNYPLHWVMAYRMGWEKLIDKALHDGGKGLLGANSKQVMLGHTINPETAYTLSFSAAHGIAQVGRMALPLTLGSLFMAPGAGVLSWDAISSVKEYFSGDDDQKDKAFFGGAASLVGLAPPTAVLQGPFVDDVTRLVNWQYAKHLNETGGIYGWSSSPAHEAARFLLGLNPNDPRVYENDWRRKDLTQMIGETYGWQANRSIPKWLILAKHAQAGRLDKAMSMAANIAGIRGNRDNIFNRDKVSNP